MLILKSSQPKARMYMDNKYDFSDIAPFDDSQFMEKMALLVKEPGFENAVKFVLPDVDYTEFAQQLLKVDNKNDFQLNVMGPFLEMLAARTTKGITGVGFDRLSNDTAYTFLSNHRDIVLDASFLNLCLIKHGMPTSEVAIGNNLLIYEWITDLVKLNKSFIVKRNLRLTKALEAARQLSAYIHYAIGTKHESVWIAQREGRAKDSNDLTQESLVKMLGLEGPGTLIDNLQAINICPVAISYEYDPNDYLKAREFLLRRLDPEFKKTQRDDLFSMETGLLGFKGHVYFNVSPCINSNLENLRGITDKIELVKRVCTLIDNAIHAHYHIYGVNYIAADLLHGDRQYAVHYTADEEASFCKYIDSQLDKVDIPDISDEDRRYMYEMMLTMYANPLSNKQLASAHVEI